MYHKSSYLFKKLKCFQQSKALTKPDLQNKEPLRGTIITDFSAALEMTSKVLLECLNKNLRKAKNAKKDEFYTQLPDIERELSHYTRHFKGKVVLYWFSVNWTNPFHS